MNSSYSDAPATLQEALAHAAQAHGARGLTIFDGRGRASERRSYRELHGLVYASAARFLARGLALREPVLVALPTSWSWIEAWFGVLVAGGLPTAISVPGAMAADESHLVKLGRVMEKIGARWVVGAESLREQAAKGGHTRVAAGVVTLDELAATTASRSFTPHRAEADEVAFLQLTSGSTGLPRAVMISHRAAIHNPLASCEAIGAPFGAPAPEWADCMVAWLPLYHDMGLIGCLMLPLLTGLDCWLLRPETFLARPHRWLEELGRHGTSFVPAPNFAYQLCVERIRDDQLAGLDLRSWRAALTGAEMVRPETAAAFVERFGPCGFSPTAFQPCYGLAEGTLAVTFDQRGEGVRTLPAPVGADSGLALAEVVSTGTPIRDTEVAIRAANGATLPEGVIGEVCIKGPGVFSGYYNEPEATAASFADGWFATGDLGFLAEGELYLTGRTKDVLIIHGHNMMPDELERLADRVTGGGGLLRSAAFSVARGAEGEQAVMVVEVTAHDSEALAGLEQQIRSRIGRALGLPLADLVFVRRGRIPRTTSGKMQRAELRARYLAGELERLQE